MAVAVYIVAILMGLLVIAPVAAKNNQGVKDALEKVDPFQGMIGLVVAVFAVIAFLIYFAERFQDLGHVLYLASIFALCLILAVLGFLRGYTVIKEQVLTSSEQAQEKAESFREKWEPRQTQMGYLAVGLGVLALLLNITA